MGVRPWWPGVCCAALILISQAVIAAQLPGDPVLGRDIAEGWCGECHNTLPGGIDLLEAPPAFQALADDPAFTETALRAFLQTTHADMPDVMPTPEETDHLIAYILSLKGH
jgi:mono/diheme cytochrome c family protein